MEPFFGLENWNVHKNGSLVRLETSGVPILDEKGQLAGYRGIDRDITERKKAEEALHQSEERFKLVAEVAKVLVYEVNIEQTNITIYRGEDVLGYNPGEIPEKTEWWLNQIHPDDRAKIESTFRTAIQEGKDYSIEYRIKRKQGNYITAHDTAKTITNQEGKVIKFVGGMRDITERNKSKEALKDSEERLKRSQEIAHLGSWELDLKQDKLTWSDEVYRIFGLKPQEFTASYEAFLTFVHPEDRAAVNEAYMSSVHKGKDGYEIEHRVVRKDNGEVRFVHEKCHHVRDQNGHVVKSLGMIHDITERKKAEANLREYKDNLEKLVEERTKQLKDSERLAAIGATAGMVGHDIRNPLQAILSDTYLLKEEFTPMPESKTKEAVAESLESIEKNIEYINKIVQDLQDYARPLTPQTEKCELYKILAEVTDEKVIPSNIHVYSKIEENAKEIVTDAALLKRVMANLVNNAVQAMPQGGELSIHAYEETNDITITVQDTGGGIPQELRAKIFTPLFTTKSKGQGFGLAVVKRITEVLGGSVTFESKENVGTTFILRFPQPPPKN